jgi:hypothetical protein
MRTFHSHTPASRFLVTTFKCGYSVPMGFQTSPASATCSLQKQLTTTNCRILPSHEITNHLIVNVQFTLRLVVYCRSVRLGVKPLEPLDRYFSTELLRSYSFATSSLTRRWSFLLCVGVTCEMNIMNLFLLSRSEIYFYEGPLSLHFAAREVFLSILNCTHILLHWIYSTFHYPKIIAIVNCSLSTRTHHCRDGSWGSRTPGEVDFSCILRAGPLRKIFFVLHTRVPARADYDFVSSFTLCSSWAGHVTCTNFV